MHNKMCLWWAYFGCFFFVWVWWNGLWAICGIYAHVNKCRQLYDTISKRTTFRVIRRKWWNSPKNRSMRLKWHHTAIMNQDESLKTSYFHMGFNLPPLSANDNDNKNNNNNKDGKKQLRNLHQNYRRNSFETIEIVASLWHATVYLLTAGCCEFPLIVLHARRAQMTLATPKPFLCFVILLCVLFQCYFRSNVRQFVPCHVRYWSHQFSSNEDLREARRN